MAELELKGMDVKNLTNRYHKLEIVRKLETDYGMNIWSPQTPTKTDMSDECYRLVRAVFRTKLAKPTTPQELIEFYGALVKSTTSRKLINIDGGQIKINTEYVTEHLELNEFKNERRSGFSPEAQKHFKLPTQEVQFVDATGLHLDD
jgi:hypothetical protein